MENKKSKKVTMATVKSFIRKNLNNLVVYSHSSFSGMTDGLESVNKSFKVDPKKYNKENKNSLGLDGIWFVGGNDYIRVLPNGYHIFNCCGSFDIVLEEGNL